MNEDIDEMPVEHNSQSLHGAREDTYEDNEPLSKYEEHLPL